MIVKIQRPLDAPSEVGLLVYPKSRAWVRRMVLPEGEVAALFGDAVRIFCRVDLRGEHMRVLERVADRTW